MRTVGRHIRPGERRRIQCDHCNALFDKRDLRRDAEGLWTCQQEGRGRDGTTLTRGNAEALRAFAQRSRVSPERTGLYPTDNMTPIASLTGMLTTEAAEPLLTEDGTYILMG